MAFPARLLRLGLLALALAAFAAPAAAQGWFGNLFGGGSPLSPRPRAPAYPGYGGGNGYVPRGGYNAPPDEGEREPPPRRHVQKHRRKPVEDAAKETPKEKALPKNATLFVGVFGDSLGQMLADGLDDALADRPDVGVLHRAKGSTGLVASDFYDWPKAIDDLLAGRTTAADGKDAAEKGASGKDAPGDGGGATKADGKTAADAKAEAKPGSGKPPKIDVAVMMIGSNDRQAIRENGKTLPFGSPDWTAAYTRRVLAIDEAFRAHGVPLIWVGLPITKSDGFADAMASLNDITREAAAKSGAVYVDTWEAFSDDNGDFSSFGPDINGQTVRLRSADGIHFTKAGARKLAHFVDAHVRRALDGKVPAPQLPTADAPEAGGGKAVAAVKPDAGPIRNLNEPPESRDGTLAPAPGAAAPRRDGLVATTLVRGEAMPIPAGRADDARWPAAGTPEP